MAIFDRNQRSKSGTSHKRIRRIESLERRDLMAADAMECFSSHETLDTNAAAVSNASTSVSSSVDAQVVVDSRGVTASFSEGTLTIDGTPADDRVEVFGDAERGYTVELHSTKMQIDEPIDSIVFNENGGNDRLDNQSDVTSVVRVDKAPEGTDTTSVDHAEERSEDDDSTARLNGNTETDKARVSDVVFAELGEDDFRRTGFRDSFFTMSRTNYRPRMYRR